jgi:hypothetical protein
MANDPLYDLRVERLREDFNMKAEEARQEAETIRSMQGDLRDALASNDREYAKRLDRDICEAEQRYLGLVRELQPQQQGLTQAKAEYVSRHGDQLLRPHWSGLRHQNGVPVTNLEAIAYGHDRAAQMGIPEDSPEYFQALDVLGPVGEPTTITSGDEALNLVRRSKYGKDLKAVDYNKQVRKLAAAKAGGNYRD